MRATILGDLITTLDGVDTVEVGPLRKPTQQKVFKKSGPGIAPSLQAEQSRQQIAEDYMRLSFAG
jgi:hypothetical protein